MEAGTNVTVEVSDDGIATIMIDLNQRHGQSQSGKTIIVGSTHGAQAFRDGEGRKVSLSINAYSKQA